MAARAPAPRFHPWGLSLPSSNSLQRSRALGAGSREALSRVYEARGVTPGGAATPPHLDRAGPQKSRHQIRARGSLCTLPPSPYESTGPRSSPSKGSRGGDREVETACAQPCTCRGGRGGAGRLVPGGASFVLPSRRPRPGLAAGGGGRPRGAGAGPRLTCSPLGSYNLGYF